MYLGLYLWDFGRRNQCLQMFLAEVRFVALRPSGSFGTGRAWRNKLVFQCSTLPPRCSAVRGPCVWCDGVSGALWCGCELPKVPSECACVTDPARNLNIWNTAKEARRCVLNKV